LLWVLLCHTLRDNIMGFFLLWVLLCHTLRDNIMGYYYVVCVCAVLSLPSKGVVDTLGVVFVVPSLFSPLFVL